MKTPLEPLEIVSSEAVEDGYVPGPNTFVMTEPVRDHTIKVRPGNEVTDLERGIAVFAAPRCRFCKRSDVIEQGIYTRVSFPDGIGLVCDLCREKADEPGPDVIEWRGADVEVAS